MPFQQYKGMPSFPSINARECTDRSRLASPSSRWPLGLGREHCLREHRLSALRFTVDRFTHSALRFTLDTFTHSALRFTLDRFNLSALKG